MKKWLYIILACIISSCENNRGKYGGYKMEYENGLDYYIVLDKIDTVLENYPNYNRGSFVKFYKNKLSVDTLFIAFGGLVIESFVDYDNVCFDEKFVIIKQKPLKYICECNDTCLIKKYPNKNDLPTFKMCKDALEKSKYYQYWIIVKIGDSVYGPFNKKQYLLQRLELRVPKALKLKYE